MHCKNKASMMSSAVVLKKERHKSPWREADGNHHAHVTAALCSALQLHALTTWTKVRAVIHQ